MAEIVLRQKAFLLGLGEELIVDSAGIAAEVGFDIDRRSRKALERRDYAWQGHRARQFEPDWMNQRDLVVAMDQGHLNWLERRALKQPHPARLQLLLSYGDATKKNRNSLEIEDPYFGDEHDFDMCLGLIEAGCSGLLADIASELGP
jgi:protein-tyrosine phosphatase